MKISDIANLRLSNQHITATKFSNPADVVGWFGAVQAQDYLGALWAVGQRCKGATEASVEKAIADKTIVRSWPMRGTLHFVAAADARWMFELLMPRIQARIESRSRQLELDKTVLARSRKLIIKALRDGKQLRRDAIYKLLETDGISTAAQRGMHILVHFAHERLICFGARQGKQPTFTLFEEWVPASKPIERDEALAKLAERYFTSHGPATLQDFIWWSGLTTSDARKAVELAKVQLVEEAIDGQTYWLAYTRSLPKTKSPTVYLLPPFDEYTVAYKDRSAVLNPAYNHKVNTGNGIFSPIVVLNGQVVGSWKRSIKRDRVELSATLFIPFAEAEMQALSSSAGRFGEFLNTRAVLSQESL
jgi:hypothetical protein